MPSILRICTILQLLATIAASAQTVVGDLLPASGEGRDFWICFQRNFRNSMVHERTQSVVPTAWLTLRLAISSQSSTSVTIEVPGLGFTRTIEQLRPGTVEEVLVPDVAQVTASDMVERLAVHVRAEAPVTVVAMNTRYQTTDTYAAIPVEALGTEYRAVGYRWLQRDLLSQVAVVATEDSTVVRIVPSWFVVSEPQLALSEHASRGELAYRFETRIGSDSSAATAQEVTRPRAEPMPSDSQRLRRHIDVRRQPAPRATLPDSTRSTSTPRVAEGDRGVVRSALAMDDRGVTRFERPPARAVANVRDRTTPFPDAAGSELQSELSGAPGDTMLVVLSRGDVYQIRPKYLPAADCDLTGSLVLSSKPVAVFSGHNCAYVPSIGTKACNLLVEQIPPVRAWGRRYVVGTLAERSGSLVRIVASQDSTQLSIEAQPRPGSGSTADAARPLVETVQLAAGQFHELRNATGPLEIRATRPVLVAQFAPGYGNGDDVGDPMMIVVPPVEQFGTVFTTVTTTTGSWHHYLNIVAPTAGLETVTLDGGRIDQTLFTEVGSSGLSVGAVPVSAGMHTVASSAPIGLYSYGFGFDDDAYDAYGHGGGQLYLDLNATSGGAPDAEAHPDLGVLTPER